VTDILDELSWRGLLALSTDEEALRKAFRFGTVTFYCGFDPTAAGLHIGNLVQLLTMRRIQDAGHRPIGLVGGATGLIGDPSGKSAERVLNERDTVAAWVERIRAEEERFLDFTPGPTGASIVSNLDWTAELSALDFLRDIGKHFPVNRMLARESVKGRLEAGGLSYTEFSYQILQAYDYLELYRRYGCTLQLGGSDQWGNLVAGVDLIGRVEGSGSARTCSARTRSTSSGSTGPTRRSPGCCGSSPSGPGRRSKTWSGRPGSRPPPGPGSGCWPGT
jgi:tyrosyl-tRNA synthetase